MAGFEYKHYQKIESGRRPNLRLDTLERLAKAFDLEVCQLVSGELPAKTRLVPASKGARSERRRRSAKKLPGTQEGESKD